MAKKVSDSQVAGIKAHAKAKNKETIDKVSKAIDKLKRKNKPINFETVSKEAGVSIRGISERAYRRKADYH